MITRIIPDTNAVNVRGRELVVHFDEVISERPAVAAPTLADLVLVSPRDGQPNVDWNRNAITIAPRRGWRANTAYTVTLLPGIADLRGNVRNTTTQVTFSTGPRIPATTVRGVVFDALTGVPIPNALIEARPVTDSTLVYIAAADSVGQFHMRGLQPMQYAVRAYSDQNRNRGLDPGEPVDSTRLNLADSLSLELLAFVHDTAGPKISAAVAEDSVTVRVTFTTPLDPRTPLDAAHYLVLRSDSTRLPVRIVTARPDTASNAPPPPLTPSSPTAPGSTSAVPIPAIRGTAPAVTRARPTRPLLFRDVAVVLSAKLQPGATYTVRAIDALGPTGRRLTSARTFSVAKLPAPRDSVRTRTPSAKPVGPATPLPGRPPVAPIITPARPIPTRSTRVPPMTTRP
ncbi:MAG: Ig-like domain-containing protein [Gemmatimonadaceae bacterium]